MNPAYLHRYNWDRRGSDGKTQNMPWLPPTFRVLFFFDVSKKTRGNDSTRPAQLFLGGERTNDLLNEVYVHNDWEDFRFKALKEI